MSMNHRNNIFATITLVAIFLCSATIQLQAQACPAGSDPVTVDLPGTALFTSTAGGEWEFGPLTIPYPSPPTDPDCEGVAVGPGAAPNGSSVWATDLDGCYPPFGNADSSLEMTIPDICTTPPAGCTGPNDPVAVLGPNSIDFSYWYQTFGDFDEIMFGVNGVDYFTDNTSGPNTVVDWTAVSVELPACPSADYPQVFDCLRGPWLE